MDDCDIDYPRATAPASTLLEIAEQLAALARDLEALVQKPIGSDLPIEPDERAASSVR